MIILLILAFFREISERGGTIWVDRTVNVEASTNSPFGDGDEKRSGIWELFSVCKFTMGDGCVYPYLSRSDSRRVRHTTTLRTITSTSISVHSSVEFVRMQTDPSSFLAIEAKSLYGERHQRVREKSVARHSAIVQSNIRSVIMSALESAY